MVYAYIKNNTLYAVCSSLEEIKKWEQDNPGGMITIPYDPLRSLLTKQTLASSQSLIANQGAAIADYQKFLKDWKDVFDKDRRNFMEREKPGG